MTEINIALTKRHEFLIVTLEGELDFSNVQSVAAKIRGSVSNDMPGLVVDLSSTRYVDSAGVRLLFDLVNRVEACRQGMCLVLSDQSPLRRLLSVTRLDAVASIYPSVEECLAASLGSADDRTQ